MSDSPKKISVEGRTVADAAVEAAKQLGVAAAQVRYELDLSHFKTPDGRRRAMDTVRINAWAIDAQLVAGADAAKEWLVGLFETMGADAEVSLNLGQGKTASLVVNGKAAGRLAPAAGALTVLVGEMLARTEHSDWNVTVEIPRRERRDDGDRDDRGRGRDRDDRGRGRDRDDRGPRRDDRGPRRDDRGPRRDDRGPRRDDRGPRRDDRGRDDRGRGRREEGGRNEEREAELRKLAVRLAEKVQETGGAETIRRSLNSYERRVVHMTVSDIAGVETESVEDDEGRRTVVIRAAGSEGAES